MFFFLITKAIPLKNRENQTSYHFPIFVAHLADENQSHCLAFNSIPFPHHIWACPFANSLLVGLPVCVPAGKQDGRQVGARACLQASVCMPCLYAFVYCTIPLLLHYYVDRRMYCTTDLYHSNFTSLKPQSIADTFIWSFAVVNLHNNTTANQHIIETMLLPICIELLSWLSGSVLHCFSKPLVRWACKQARLYLPKIAFPYWSNVCFGCDWHISTSNWHYCLFLRWMKIRLCSL